MQILYNPIQDFFFGTMMKTYGQHLVGFNQQQLFGY